MGRPKGSKNKRIREPIPKIECIRFEVRGITPELGTDVKKVARVRNQSVSKLIRALIKHETTRAKENNEI